MAGLCHSGHTPALACKALPRQVTSIALTKIRRGNHIFLSCAGDHSPRHVHVYKDGILVLKWNLDDRQPMKGKPSARLLALIDELVKEGLI